MSEKLGILSHHVELIRNEDFGAGGRECLDRDIANHVEALSRDGEYIFSDEKPQKEFEKAIKTATIAILDNNFESIEDNVEIVITVRQNYDLICRKCPNFISEDSPLCKNNPSF